MVLASVLSLLGIGALVLTPGDVSASSAPSRQGLVAGWVGPCVGTATKAQYAKIPEVVSLIQGPKLVAYKKLHGKNRYVFHSRPGSYLLEVSVNGLAPGSVIPNQRVILRPGQLVHVNLVPSCK
jgi:hypothetical protein